MSWFTHTTIAPGLTHISDGGEDSIYLFEGDRQAVLFDTGFGLHDLAGYVATLTSKPIEVFQTHGHPDHAMGCYQFPRVWMHEADIPMCSGPVSDEMTVGIRDHFFGGTFPDDFPLELWKARRPLPIPLDREHYDYEEFQIDVIHTPGHTRGQVAYHIKPQGYLIIGDTLVHGKAWMHLDDSTDLETYRRSLTLIAALATEDTPVLCGHSEKPIPNRIVQAFPDFIAAVERGEVPGRKESTFAGDGIACILDEPYGVLAKETT